MKLFKKHKYQTIYSILFLIFVLLIGSLFVFTSDIFVANAVVATGGIVTDVGGYRIHTFTSSGSCPATGGVITEVGGYCIHTFTSSGIFTPATSDNVEVLVVGGGGGGAGRHGGGGGGGGLLYNAALAVSAQAYSVTVGAGGAGGIYTTTPSGEGKNGNNSVFSTLTAVGGGGGQTYDGGASIGGSGGGGAGINSTAGLAGTSGQGNAGGTGGSNPSGGGGGGAGAVGSNATSNGGAGGVGLAYSISGSSVFYAGGGGGGGETGYVGGAGSSGGGGHGGDNGGNINQTSGTANTGGGGGGTRSIASELGSPGGSGIVIIRYPYSDTFTVTTAGNVEVLVVGGGGGGGSFGGGGGAGGLIYSPAYTVSPSNITVTIGDGGNGYTTSDQGIPGFNGSNSVFGSLTAIGGGGGGSRYGSPSYLSGAGSNGGSGGGSSSGNSGSPAAGGTATPGQGNNGGVGRIGTAPHAHAGGGGAGAVGVDGTSSGGGNGGIGLAYSISGTTTYYAGGGGGGNHTDGGTGGSGGLGGGGAGVYVVGATGVAGTANTGGGGGGGGYTGTGGKGGSGIVIVRYPLPITLLYRKPIIINNTSNPSTLTDYQVLVAVDTASLVTAGKLQSDCDDLRFTDNSISYNTGDWTNNYPYWIESGCNTATTKIWVKVDSITASSNKTIYMYYGNTSAESLSNGDNTFEFFDDFNESSLDTVTNWTVLGGSTSITSSILKVIGTTGNISSKATFPVNSRFRGLMKYAANTAYMTFGFNDSAAYANLFYANYENVNVLNATNRNPHPTYTTTNLGNVGHNTYNIFEIRRNSTTNSIFLINDSVVATIITNVPTGSLPVIMFGQAQDLYSDWVFVSKYTSPEPTIQVGSEEIENEPPAISSVGDTPDPLQVGNDVSFEISWSDPDEGDQTKIHICKTDAITDQTCDGGSWCDTTEWSASSPTSCDYATQVGDIGTKNYYAFISDDSDETSTSTTGTFEVITNATSTISSVTDAPDPIPANSNILFTVNWSDPGDQTKIHICKTDAITTQTCDGGSWCDSSEFSTSSPSTCTYTAQLVDLGTQNYYAFVCDSVNNHSVSETGTFEVVRLNESNSLTLATTTSSGFLTSSIFDSGVNGGASFHSLLWQGTLCSSCFVKFQLASSNSSSGPWTYYGPFSTSDYYTLNPGVSITLPRNGDAAHQNKRYIRYKVYLEPYNSQSPEVDDIIINWSP